MLKAAFKKMMGSRHIREAKKLQPVIDEQAQAEAAKLDGCYALITDLTAAQASKERIDARYHDLAQVERGRPSAELPDEAWLTVRARSGRGERAVLALDTVGEMMRY